MELKFLFILLAVLSLVLFLLPRFYFNQLEHKSRQVFSSIEEARSITNNDIEQRSGREGGVKSSEEVKSLSEKIAAGLNKIANFVNEHELILNKQGKIVFLLPSKYKEYYNLKKEAFDKYYSSLRKINALKEYESGMMDVFVKKDQVNQLMSDLGNPSNAHLGEPDKIIMNYKDSTENIKKYFDEGYITEEFYNGMWVDINANVDIYNLFNEADENNYSLEETMKRVEEINSKYKREDLITLFRDSHDKIIVGKHKEWSDLYNQADELTYGALEHYDNNNLAYDPLSICLSKFNTNYPKNTTSENDDNSDSENTKIDLNGDGREETLSLISSGGEEKGYYTVLLIAYDEEGKEIGRLPEGMPIEKPFSDSAKVYTPIKKNKKQFVSYDFMVGPHSSETMFFGLFELKAGGMGILPVCLTPDANSAHDCLFWSGEVGSLTVDDFDEDGVMEVVEIVDEYPEEGSIAPDIEKMINEEFEALGQDAADGMIRVAKMEQGGRGSRVIWGIYRYNGEYFEKQLGDNYEKYYKLVNAYLRRLYADYPTIMRKSEMSKLSLEYNEFMRSFWTR